MYSKKYWKSSTETNQSDYTKGNGGRGRGMGTGAAKLCIFFSIVLIFETDEYITFSEKKFKSTEKKNKD